MVQKWTRSSVTKEVGGVFQIVVTPPNGGAKDVTYFRGHASQITSYTIGDPFGYATAVIQFPQITPFDECGSGEIYWLTDYANVDIYYVPTTYSSGASRTWIDPLTNAITTVTASADDTRIKVWEGFIASTEIADENDSYSVTAQCQGALFQLDHYVQLPFYPQRPYPFEVLIKQAFDPKIRPNLRTKALRTVFPTGWSLTAPGGTPTVFTPVGVTPGQNITGWSTRQTGSGEHALTGFVQNLLSTMFTPANAGVVSGDQWTIKCLAGRIPQLYVRQRARTPDITLACGQEGISSLSLTRDLTQVSNIIFGSGTDQAGVDWRNAYVANDGSRTDYNPLAADPSVWPPSNQNKVFSKQIFASQTYYQFGAGFNENQAITAAQAMLERDRDPGYAGTLTLEGIDPPEMSRWLIQGGMTLKLQYFAGSGADGVIFHISNAEHNPVDDTHTLTIDTKFRDLLTLEEAITRNRDALTPVKMLQVNKRSILIPDTMAPWDYKAGSGYIPKKSVAFFNNIAPTDTFPWTAQTAKYPPHRYPHYYVKVDADAGNRRDRWTLGIHLPILMAEKGTIMLTQMAAFDEDGNQIQVEFHFSVYYAPVTVDDMPFNSGSGPSPFITNAFQTTDQNGMPFPPGYFLAPDQSIILGWGTKDQPAGYSPGQYSNQYPKTGQLIDSSSWTFDCTNNPDFNKNLATGKREPQSAYTVYGALYCEDQTWGTGPVFFLGRFYNQPAGTS